MHLLSEATQACTTYHMPQILLGGDGGCVSRRSSDGGGDSGDDDDEDGDGRYLHYAKKLSGAEREGIAHFSSQFELGALDTKQSKIICYRLVVGQDLLLLKTVPIRAPIIILFHEFRPRASFCAQ